MKDPYNELFDGVHLSETAKKNILENEVEQSCTGKRQGKSRAGIKVAVLLGIVFLGSTGIYAATQLPVKQHTSKWQVQVEDGRAEIALTTNKPKKEEKQGLYDVKLSYIPDGFKQDEEDTFFYRKGEKDENGFFSVILYHLDTEYKTIREADGLEKIRIKDGQGYIGGKKNKRPFALLMFEDVNYMVYIDGANMSKKEVRKIAEGAALYQVEDKKDIQASYIEWTEERQKEKDALIEQMKKAKK